MKNRFSVSIDFELPIDVTEEQFEEWFKYSVIDWGGCSGDNPLLKEEKDDLVSMYHIW